jgi:hypothetical protein
MHDYWRDKDSTYMLENVLSIFRSWEKHTTMPHARAAATGRAVARQAGRQAGGVRAWRDGNDFAINQLWEFSSILMVHYPVSAQAL